MEVSYQPYRRGTITARGERIENAAKVIDEYLYVDTKHQSPHLLQLWRKHPDAHLPFLIFDIPPTATVAEVINQLRTMDKRGRDIGLEAAILSDEKYRYQKKKQRYENETFARELGKFIQNHY